MTQTNTNSEPEPIPTEEVLPQSLDELFNKDPLQLSDQEIVVICAAFRQQRKNFALEDKEAKAAGKPVKKKAIQNVDLDNLDLDLDF